MAQLAIKTARDAYCRDKTVRPRFRKHAAVAYDQRIMSFKSIDRVSLLTLEGRVVVPFILGSYQREGMAVPKGQSDLVLRADGKWFLIVTANVPEAAPIPATDFLGVDLGIANIATDSDGTKHSGKSIDDVRAGTTCNGSDFRQGYQGGEEKIKRAGKKEARFRKHENHRISKQIVETAKGTARGIALEDLSGIRERATARGGDARNRLSGWAFAQLGTFLGYKAALAGVPVVFVDPAYTSRRVPSVAIANAPTARVNPCSAARRAGLNNTPMSSAPGTSATPPWCKPGLR